MSKRKKAEPEFDPEVIEDGSDDKQYFFASIPNQIEANDNYGERLEGFPLNIVFAALRSDAQQCQQSLLNVCYEPAPETCRENSRRKELRYFTKPKNGYSIRVICEKASNEWRIEKFKGKKLVQAAFGSTFDGAMIHTTMDRPEPGEH